MRRVEIIERTIVVLLILATVSIQMLGGDNGIIKQAVEAKTATEISEIEEIANIIAVDLSKGDEDVTMSDIADKLRDEGYKIEQIAMSGSEITGISIDPSSISVATGGTAQITVTYEGDTGGIEYYAVVNGKYYKMIFTNNGVKIERTPSDVGGSSGTEESM